MSEKNNLEYVVGLVVQNIIVMLLLLKSTYLDVLIKYFYFKYNNGNTDNLAYHRDGKVESYKETI